MTTPLGAAAVNMRTIWETEYTGLRTSIVIVITTIILPYIYRVIRRLLSPSPVGPIVFIPSKADSGTDRASDAAKISRDDGTSKEDIPVEYVITSRSITMLERCRRKLLTVHEIVKHLRYPRSWRPRALYLDHKSLKSRV